MLIDTLALGLLLLMQRLFLFRRQRSLSSVNTALHGIRTVSLPAQQGDTAN